MKKKIEKTQARQTRNKPSQIKPSPSTHAVEKTKLYLGIIIAVFAFVLYANSIYYDYTLDDAAVTVRNTTTTKGLSGIPEALATDYWYGSPREQLRGPVYRPASIILFATVWQFSPDNPHAYHFINVLLYSFTCFFLFFVLCRLFKTQNLLFPFVCTLLYTAHPIHTEVVDSIKSMDEILCFLFGLISIWSVLKYISTKSTLWFALCGVSFFLSLISKETGVTFLVIVPLVIFFFTDAPWKRITGNFLYLLGITALWLVIRTIVFKDLPPTEGNTASIINNTLNAAPDKISRYATAFYILLRYILLLFFPHPLSYDYSFAQIKIQTLSDLPALFGIILYLALGIYCVTNFRRENVVAFGILFFLITLSPVSNLFFPMAATMAERFMYMPSLGFCIIVTYFLIRLTRAEAIKSRYKNVLQFFSLNYRVFLIVLVISALYYFKTTTRNRDWKDNLTLFTHDVNISTNSARINQILGSALVTEALNSPNEQHQEDTFNLAKKYLKRALDIYPEFYPPLSHLGVIYIDEKKFDSAEACLKKAKEIMPEDIDVNFNYALVLFHLKKYDSAIKVFNQVLQLSPKNEKSYYNLAAIYHNTGDYDKAIFYYSKVIELNPNNADAYYYSGVLLKSKGDTLKGNQFMDKGVSLGHKE